MMERFVLQDRDNELTVEQCTGEGSQARSPDPFLLLSLQAAGTMGGTEGLQLGLPLPSFCIRYKD